MLPLIAGLAARAGLSLGARATASTASRAAVTSAARSGAISTGTGAAAGAATSRVLSPMQFGSSAARSMGGDGSSAPAQAAAPSPADELGWLRP
ncbi:hypothetical protein [Streptomyces sp. NPDC088360]|uniref:hypothetical protein n=1 Tax=Streptomyces sp. NPDC088360 TaxID=3154515 RepID=UPI00344F662C